jgi:LPS export ABC transporter protein LptC
MHARVPYVIASTFHAMLRMNWRFIGGLAVVLILGAITYGSYLMLQESDVNVPPLFKPAPGARLLIQMEGFRFSRSEDGRVAWRLDAGSADLYETQEAQLREVEIVFSSPDGKRAALIGDHARMDIRSGDASIRRGGREVRIVTSDGYLMTTDSLIWKAGARVVRTADPFRVLGREIYVEGKGLSADVDMRKLVIDSHVKAVLQE